MRIAIVGIRGVPARYGGLETCAEEVGSRLAARGHDVWCYCRRGCEDDGLEEYQGIRRIELPCLKFKVTETYSRRGKLIIPAFALLLNTHFMQESTWAWIPVLSLAGAGIFASLRYPEHGSRQHALAGRFTLIASLYLIFDLLALVILVVMVILQ